MSTVFEDERLMEAAKVMDTLARQPAANDDHVSDQAVSSVAATGGWNAYDVWRRLIKDARDRRENRGQATRR